MQHELSPDLEIELTKRIGALAAAFPYAQISGETIKVYARMLADIPLEVLDAVASQAMAECEFFPTIARVREMAMNLASPTGQHVSGFEAWEQVIRQIRSVGSYGRPGFIDPLITRAVECLGWPELCQSDNQVADRSHFVRIYEQLVERERAEARLLPESRELRASVLHLAEQKKIAGGKG